MYVYAYARVLYVSLLGMGGGWHCGCHCSIQLEGQKGRVEEGGERCGALEGRRGCMIAGIGTAAATLVPMEIGGAAAGVPMLWEEGAAHESCWHHNCWACAQAWGYGD